MKGILFLLLLFAWLLVPTKNIYPDLLSVVDVARQESRGRFKFYFSDLLLPSEAKQFTRDVREAQKKVEAYWGNTFDGNFWIEVSPRHRISMALIPAWRGERGKMLFPVHRVKERQAAIIHEMVHVYAPNQNRFLAEGLAVYLHHRLGGNPAFPNFGKPFTQISNGLPHDVKLADLDAIVTPRRLQIAGAVDERHGYMIAASFVGFLIEGFGLNRFAQLYALSPLQGEQRLRVLHRDDRTGQYVSIFGKSLDALEREWVLSLQETH